MGAFDHEASISGDVYVQRLATYIRRNEESLANGLLCFSKERPRALKPLRASFTTHHLYYITERIGALALGVDVGPLSVRLDGPHHEHTFVLFMASNMRSQRPFDSDARLVLSLGLVKTMVLSALVYWLSFCFSKDPRVIQKDVRYLYLAFTKLPCLVLSPHTKVHCVAGYEEYPCDTLVPLQMFKNLQVLELVEYEPNEVFGWHSLSEHLRILIVRNTKMANLQDVLHVLVADDEHGRLAFKVSHAPPAPSSGLLAGHALGLGVAKSARATARGVRSADHATDPNFLSDLAPNSALNDADEAPPPLSPKKWVHMKQLTVTESSIAHIPAYVFRPFSNLVKLNLAKNLLEALPLGLEHLSQLKYLNLADNYIVSLAELPQNLHLLATLNLNNNKITDLSGIDNLPALEKLDVRRNKLRDTSLIRALVTLAGSSNSKLSNVFIANNNLPRSYRADLFNLFNAVRPKNAIRIDDSLPGYFERAMLLDPDSARRFYDKVMEQTLEKADKDGISSALPRKNRLNLVLGQEDPHKTTHKHSNSTGDVLESLTLFHIQDLENTFVNRKHTSVMTTASSTSNTSSTASAIEASSTPASPSLRQFSKTLKPLLPNVNVGNQSHFQGPKTPGGRLPLSPTAHARFSGLSTTLKSSSPIGRLDMESQPHTNLAPSVITPVQVQVEGFR